MDQISPELALVDPELAREARALLPGPGDCLRRRAREAPRVVALSPPREPQPTVAAPLAATTTAVAAEAPPVLVERPSAPSGTKKEPRRTVRRSRRHLGLVATGLLVLALLAVPLLAFVPPEDSMAPKLAGEPGGTNQPPHPASPEAKQAAEQASSAATPSDGQPAGSSPGSETTTPKDAASPKAKQSAATKPAAKPKPKPPATARRAATPKRPATAQAAKKAKQTVKRKSARAALRPVGPQTTIRWAAVRGADLYNVVFVRGDVRIDRWVDGNQLRLSPPGSAAAPARTFLWFAYPVFRQQAGYKLGALLDQGSVSVSAASIGGRQQPLG